MMVIAVDIISGFAYVFHQRGEEMPTDSFIDSFSQYEFFMIDWDEEFRYTMQEQKIVAGVKE